MPEVSFKAQQNVLYENVITISWKFYNNLYKIVHKLLNDNYPQRERHVLNLPHKLGGCGRGRSFLLESKENLSTWFCRLLSNYLHQILENVCMCVRTCMCMCVQYQQLSSQHLQNKTSEKSVFLLVELWLHTLTLSLAYQSLMCFIPREASIS